MKRTLVVGAALSVILAACGASDEVVASVNGVDIDRSRVEKLIPEADLQSGIYDFTRYLSVTIQWEAVAQQAREDFGIEPTEEDVDGRLTEFVAGFDEGVTLEEYLASVEATEAGIREFARQLFVQSSIETGLADTAERVSDERIAQELMHALLDWTIVCTSHILVETSGEADAVIARLEAGEDFGVVAAEVSLDVVSGAEAGDLGCTSPAGFVESFATATLEADIGEITEPVESEFGFHIILVSHREEATPEVVRATLERAALVAAVDEWFSVAMLSADVTVDEAIGVWVTEPSPQVLATN